jgi:hypothetical protein
MVKKYLTVYQLNKMKVKRNRDVPAGRQSRTSPVSGKRGCLCSDNKTYSKKCCNGSLHAQGIGVG